MLTIPRITLPDDPGNPAAQAMLRNLGLALQVATANWPEYGRQPVAPGGTTPSPALLPAVSAWMAHSGSHLHLLFEVWEQDVRAANTGDQDPVWQDSCVELFIRPAGDPEGYYNFEFNPLGVCLAAFGPDRHQRTPASTATLAGIGRAGCPWQTPFGLKQGLHKWQLALDIPASALSLHGLENWSGRSMSLNLYKCGDALPRPHYLSLFPIASPKPDFHRPECFGAVRFAD